MSSTGELRSRLNSFPCCPHFLTSTSQASQIQPTDSWFDSIHADRCSLILLTQGVTITIPATSLSSKPAVVKGSTRMEHIWPRNNSPSIAVTLRIMVTAFKAGWIIMTTFASSTVCVILRSRAWNLVNFTYVVVTFIITIDIRMKWCLRCNKWHTDCKHWHNDQKEFQVHLQFFGSVFSFKILRLCLVV